MRKSFYLPYAILCVLLLSACHGDGKDKDAYTGNQNPSSIDASTAGHWAYMALGGAQNTGSFNPLSAGDTNAFASKHESFSSQPATRPNISDLEFALASHAASLSSGKTASSSDNTDLISIQEAVDGSQSCDNKGTVEVESNGTQQQTISYNNCEMAGVLIDGVVTVNMTNASMNGSFDATFVYREFTITGVGFSLIQNGQGTLSIDLGDSGFDQTMVLNLLIEDEIEGSMIKLVNFSSRSWLEESQTGPTGRFTVSGRIYDSILGYADFTTEVTFETSNPSVMPPDYSGILRISGANGSHALVEVEHDGTASLFTIKVDADNDGTYEINAAIPYESLDSDLDLDDFDSGDAA